MKLQSHCCKLMDRFLKEKEVDICYSAKFRSYYIGLIDQTDAQQVISYCPWCGAKFPISLRDEWFKILEKEYDVSTDEIFYFESKAVNIDRNPNIPDEFKSDEWWKRRLYGADKLKYRELQEKLEAKASMLELDNCLSMKYSYLNSFLLYISPEIISRDCKLSEVVKGYVLAWDIKCVRKTVDEARVILAGEDLLWQWLRDTMNIDRWVIARLHLSNNENAKCEETGALESYRNFLIQIVEMLEKEVEKTDKGS